jgi:hypothetical protein
MSTERRTKRATEQQGVPSALMDQLLASNVRVLEEISALRGEHAASRAHTDALIAKLFAAFIESAAIAAAQQTPPIIEPLATVDDRRPPGNWRSVKQVMDISSRTNSAVHKWIRQKKVRVFQPGGPRTAIEIDVDSLPVPAAVSRRVKKCEEGG